MTRTTKMPGLSYSLPAWECQMPGYAAAVYDTIIGAEMTENWDVVRAGLDWFKQYFAEQYMVVLD